MKAIILILAASVGAVFASDIFTPAPDKLLFEVQVLDTELKERDGSDVGYFCNISFYKLPDRATVDKIVRVTLQSAILIDPTRNIMTFAYLGSDHLKDNRYYDGSQYSGRLCYRASDKRIVTWDEQQGIKTTTADLGAYYVEIRETPASYKTGGKFLSLSIVFPANPTAQQALDAVVAEIQKRTALGVDIDAFPRYGDKKIITSWKQMPDPNGGGTVYYRYRAADRTIYNKYLGSEKSAVIKKLP